MGRIAWVGLAVLATLGASVATAGATRQRLGANTPALKVTSTLDGRKVLPIRSRWRAHPNVPASQIREVDFLIDGKLLCVEHFAPYNYGSDDLHGHFGWLVTSFLAPGLHHFTSRVVLNSGKQASETVIARVVAAPKPPVALAGTWERTVSAAAAGSNFPAGKWDLVFDQVGVWELDPGGSGIAEHVAIGPDTINIDAALWMALYVNDHTKELNRYGHTDIGHGWREDGPPASYHWSVSGDQLTLTAISDSSVRRPLWEGVWTRVP